MEHKKIDDPSDFSEEQMQKAESIRKELAKQEEQVDFDEYCDNGILVWISENGNTYYFDEDSKTYLLIELPQNTEYNYGVYGKGRKDYLKEEQTELYDSLCENNTLERHLAEIDKQAYDLEKNLIKQIGDVEGLTAELKMKDMLGWVGLYKNIQNRAREIILNELIYV